MTNRIFEKIETILTNQGRSINDLQDYLRLKGVDTPVMMVDYFPKANDLHLIALFLSIPPSELICMLGHNEATARAIFDELYPAHQCRIGISREDAWQRVKSGVQFKGRKYIEIHSQVDLVLDGLSPTGNVIISCNFLNCQHRCITRCLLTGRPVGA